MLTWTKTEEKKPLGDVGWGGRRQDRFIVLMCNDGMMETQENLVGYGF